MENTKQAAYELVFVGSAGAPYFPRYRRNHKSLDSARDTVNSVRAKLEARSLPVACHTPIVYGPGLRARWENVLVVRGR